MSAPQVHSCVMLTAFHVQYGSFMFRNFRGDSPLELLSGFALEAKEMQIMLSQGAAIPESGDEQPPRAFVCIDEFGKGAEDAHATALCAAALRRMDQVCRVDTLYRCAR